MRKFTNSMGSMWVFGEGTINPEGDYYLGGRYVEPASPSLAHFEQALRKGDSGVMEITIDPDLAVAEGL